MNDQVDFSAFPRFISLQELKDTGLSQYHIRKLEDKGRLIKLTKTYYENTLYHGEKSDFDYIKPYIPNGVICLLSAAVYYNLSTYIPDAIDVAIPGKSKVSTFPDHIPVNIHYFSGDRYTKGIVTVKENMNEFQIYDIEKTVADIVRNRESVGIEETKEILTKYLWRDDRNPTKLLRYAKACKCEKTMRLYLEAML